MGIHTTLMSAIPTQSRRQTDLWGVEPKDLGNLVDILSDKVYNLVGTCSKTKGAVIEVGRIHSITSSTISRVSGTCYFEVTYDLVSLHPEIGHIYNVHVKHLYPEGIFLEFYGIKIIVPATNVESKGYLYRDGKYCSGSQAIKKGDRVEVEVLNIRYENEYQCIGGLVAVTSRQQS